MRRILPVLLTLWTAAALHAQPPIAAPDWTPWVFLIGSWRGVGTGEPGEGKGGITFDISPPGKSPAFKTYLEAKAVREGPSR